MTATWPRTNAGEAVDLGPPLEQSSGLETPSAASPGWAPDLSAERLRILEDGVDQPHLRADRPPFWPTHAMQEAMNGDVEWRPDDAIMVIDGYGYTHLQWVNSQAPRYDIDGQGRWFNLEEGRDIPSEQQPEALPGRYGVWHDGSTVRAMVAEAGHLTELPVRTTVVDALVDDLVADVPDLAAGRERLEAACATTSRGMTELTIDEVEGLLRGDLPELTPYTWSDGLPFAMEPVTPLPLEAQIIGEVAIEEPAVDLADGLWDL